MSDLVTTYRPGNWIAASAGEGWLLAEVDASDPTILTCWSLLRDAAPLDVVLDALLARGLKSVPSFAVLRLNEDGAASLVVRGRGAVSVTRAGEDHEISAHEMSTWREALIPAGWSELRLSGGDAGGERAPLSPGVGLACVLVITDPAAAPAAADPDPEPDPEPVPDDGDSLDEPQQSDPQSDWGWGADAPSSPTGDSIDAVPDFAPPAPDPFVKQAEPVSTQALSEADLPSADEAPGHAHSEQHGAAQPATEAPMVDTVRCEHGHLNPLTVGLCRVCGTALQSQVPQRLPRPRLGVLRLSTGDVVPLDRDVVLGRNPSAEAAGVAADSHLVSLESPNHDMSRTHAAVHLDGWVALLADLNSTNGTTITLPWQEPTRLRPNEPVAIEPGTVVNLANEVTFRYESTG